MTLVIGDNDWPMPVPLVQRDGRWAWDGAAGADEIVYRRVGANELGAIDVCRGFVQAQFDYAADRSRWRSTRHLRAEAPQRRRHAERFVLAHRRG